MDSGSAQGGRVGRLPFWQDSLWIKIKNITVYSLSLSVLLRRGKWRQGSYTTHDAVQQAVMQCGYDDELFQTWRGGKIRQRTAGGGGGYGFGPLREVASGARAV